jgi:pantoate--beta-alanine ligase
MIYPVRRSLTENDLTVVSIFVNPTQFAPHEDLSTYPRALSRDIEALLPLGFSVDAAPNNDEAPSSITRKVSAIFLPDSKEMYPSGVTQDVSTQKGTFVEVKGYSHQMEGRSRPTFFRGVTTVVTKLFNVIQVGFIASFV